MLSFLETTPVVPAEKTHFISGTAALQKCSVEQAGVVLLGCGGGTWLGLQPCFSRQGNARNADEVEEEEGCSQQHGRRLSCRNPVACSTGLLNLVKTMEVATRQSRGGLVL